MATIVFGSRTADMRVADSYGIPELEAALLFEAGFVPIREEVTFAGEFALEVFRDDAAKRSFNRYGYGAICSNPIDRIAVAIKPPNCVMQGAFSIEPNHTRAGTTTAAIRYIQSKFYEGRSDQPEP